MSGSGRVIKEGFLTKSPPQEKVMAQWQRRFFVLWSTRLMEYYSSSGKRPQDYRKTIDLSNCEDMVAPLPVQNRQYVIKLCIKNGAKTRDYFFECSSEIDMDSWVNCLAVVCGFSAVEEANLPCPFPPITDNSTAISPTVNKPKLRPPLPPPKPLSPPPPDIEEVVYDDPKILTKENPNFEESIEEVYDNFDEANAIRDMNKFPPPVWKQTDNLQPPPLPPSHPSRRYTRTFTESSEEFAIIESWRSNANPQPESPKSSRSRRAAENTSSPKSKKQFGSMRNIHQVGGKNKAKSKPPAPPAKPRKFGSSDDILNVDTSDLNIGGRGSGAMGRGMGFNLGNDPKFGRKLEERRQELYGENDRGRPKSWSHEQEEYEEVTYTASDEDLLSSSGEGRPGGAQEKSSSDEEYVDCEPRDDDMAPQQYLDFNSVMEEKVGKGPNTLKREEFLKRPPLPLPPQSSAGNPINATPPKIPVDGKPKFGRATSVPRLPLNSSGSDSPPPVPRRGNERPPLPPPPAEEEDAPPVPRRHPNASDKNRARAVPEPKSPPRGSPPDNPIPLPPRSLSPTTPPSASSDTAPPIPIRGVKQFDSSYSPPPHSFGGFNKAPPPLPKNSSLSNDDVSCSPASATSDHVFEEFVFGAGLPQPQEKSKDQAARPKGRVNPPIVPKSRTSYETRLPPDIGMRAPLAKKKVGSSYEENLPTSIGRRPIPNPPVAKPKPSKPPVASKPALPKSPVRTPAAAKPQVSKKPPTQPKPQIVTPKPAVGVVANQRGTNASSGSNKIVKQSTAKPFNKSPALFPSNSSRTFNVGETVKTSKPVTSRSLRSTTKPQAGHLPSSKPKPLVPPPIDRRKPLPTPSMY